MNEDSQATAIARHEKGLLRVFRPSDHKVLLRAFLWGLSPIALGVVLIGDAHIRLRGGDPLGLRPFLEAHPALAPWVWLEFAAGFFMVALTPGLSVFALRRLWLAERFLAVCREGMLCLDGEHESFWTWDELVKVEADGDAIRLDIVAAGGTRLPFYFGPQRSKEIATYSEAIRRKALFGILR